MATQDEYLRNATEAQRHADQAISDIERASWLRVAEGWLSLLKKPLQTLEETSDEVLANKGTGQDDTKSSN
jgi:hypothetical protein